MRILYLSAPGGGLETNVRVLAAALTRAGHTVVILYVDGSVKRMTQNGDSGIVEYHAPMGQMHYYLHRATFGTGHLGLLARTLEYGQAAARAISEIHARTPLDMIEVPEMYLRAKQLPAPCVIRLHSPAWLWRLRCAEPIPRTDGLERYLERQSLSAAGAVTAPSRAVANEIAGLCKVRRTIETIPYPVETDVFRPAERSGPCRILFVGRIEKRKGADTLLRAIPRVLEIFPDCEFLFAGRMSEEMKALEVSLPPQVKFLGVKPRAELVTLYQQASMVTAPSQWDNSPNVIYEAMACGAPVIATGVGGIPELVEEGVTGLLVTPGDAKGLADAMLALLRDPARGKRMGLEGRARAEENYAATTVLTRTVALYREITRA